MKQMIRRARPEDAPAFMLIKSQLPMPRADDETLSGGFLLGTDEDTYRFYIKNALCLVAEEDNSVVGFGILLPDAMLRASDVWQRRNEAEWEINLALYEHQKLGYVEQLAFLSGHRKLVIALAYNLVCHVFENGTEVLFTTTVREPVLNLAAVPLILKAGGIRAGSIDEIYPVVGRIISDIWLVEKERFYMKARQHPLYLYFEAQRVALP
jgi:hypothetical protein